MDAAGFECWLHWWYSEVKKKSDGPRLQLLDNCVDHISRTALTVVSIEFLPPNTTAKYHPLYQGLISQANIRYRSIFLRQICSNVEKKRAGENGFKNNSGRGRWGLREGQLPHVADANNIFNESWSQTGQMSIQKI